ncbi:hypothetical protein DFR24_4364 [Panacagrimonas perspica]|uniref:Uncharacterized protein n=1 Tax=Panacagrimonas perspica TaxID=381431 RepID=A0A4R7NXL1_9GAMM|nr:hypothetical protein DFR24_4364 [Panacagrimonas perspica]
MDVGCNGLLGQKSPKLLGREEFTCDRLNLSTARYQLSVFPADFVHLLCAANLPRAVKAKQQRIKRVNENAIYYDAEFIPLLVS